MAISLSISQCKNPNQFEKKKKKSDRLYMDPKRLVQRGKPDVVWLNLDTQARRMGWLQHHASVLLGSSLYLWELSFHICKMGMFCVPCEIMVYNFFFKFTQWMSTRCLLNVCHCLGPPPRSQRWAWQVWPRLLQSYDWEVKRDSLTYTA